jgi:hypothetical protein
VLSLAETEEEFAMSKTNEETARSAPTQEAIAQRAYELFLQRGSVPGYELDDWLQAEAELTADAAREAEEDEEGTAAGRSTSRSGTRRSGGRERTTSRRSLRP